MFTFFNEPIASSKDAGAIFEGDIVALPANVWLLQSWMCLRFDRCIRTGGTFQQDSAGSVQANTQASADYE